jgi:hypothetical protein
MRIFSLPNKPAVDAACKLSPLAKLVGGAALLSVTSLACGGNANPAPGPFDDAGVARQDAQIPVPVRTDANPGYQLDGPYTILGFDGPPPDSTEPAVPQLTGPQQFTLTGDCSVLTNIKFSVSFNGGSGLKDRQLAFRVSTNPKLIDPADPNIPCVDGWISVIKDANGNYIYDPNYSDNRLPNSLVSHIITDLHEPKLAQPMDRTEDPMPLIGAICGPESYGTAPVRLIDKAFNSNGDIAATFELKLNADLCNNFAYNVPWEARVQVALELADGPDGGSNFAPVPVMQKQLLARITPAPHNIYTVHYELPGEDGMVTKMSVRSGPRIRSTIVENKVETVTGSVQASRIIEHDPRNRFTLTISEVNN